MSSIIAFVSRALKSGWCKAVLVLAGITAYQGLIYYSVVKHPESGFGEALMSAPLLIALSCVFAKSARERLFLSVLAMLCMTALVVWMAPGPHPAYFYPVPFLLVYGFLFWLFARTLRAGRQPLITKLALHVHGQLPDGMILYTRRVTLAWCAFFAAMVVASVLLFLLAPLPVWSVFNNLLNLPLVVAMYLGEYAWRLWRYPNFSHASIATVVRAFRNFDFNRPAADR